MRSGKTFSGCAGSVVVSIWSGCQVVLGREPNAGPRLVALSASALSQSASSLISCTLRPEATGPCVAIGFSAGVVGLGWQRDQNQREAYADRFSLTPTTSPSVIRRSRLESKRVCGPPGAFRFHQFQPKTGEMAAGAVPDERWNERQDSHQAQAEPFG